MDYQVNNLNFKLQTHRLLSAARSTKMSLMNVLRSALPTLLVVIGCFKAGYGQTDTAYSHVPLTSLDAFRNAGKNWVVASGVTMDYTKANDIKPVSGSGILVNTLARNGQMQLITKEEFGDLELELDFLMAKGSNSGVYLMGRYEVQLLDSWTVTTPASTDLGAIYKRPDGEHGVKEGTPPAMNVARAPGLWQHLQIRFRAPRFNDKGEKTDNARFESVYLNGVLVQDNTAVTGPTLSALYPDDEKARGPLMIQGDHGPEAFRNISYRPLADSVARQVKKDDEEDWNATDPIFAEPGTKPAMVRTFLMYGDKKLTHVTSVGHPNQVNYSYDVKRGALFQVWRGKFLDVTRAWHERGETQLGVPRGSVIVLSDAPFVASLNTPQAAWPDTIAFEDLDNKGYVLDKQRSPTFDYFIQGMEVRDSILIQPGGEGITRTVSVSHPGSTTYCRIAAGSRLEKLSDDLYAVNERSYYIRIDKQFKPVIRSAANGQELLVRYDNTAVTYSLIW